MLGRSAGLLVALLVITLGGCAAVSSKPTVGPSPATPSPSPSATRAPSATPTASAATTPTCLAGVPRRLSLTGKQDRAFAFAPLDNPREVTTEGEVDGAQAWSTSKVLVVAAFLDTVADGDPGEASAADRRLIGLALGRSDGAAIRSLKEQIPGSSGRAMTVVLRDIGDQRTTAPDSYEGTMSWTLREQVRFMAALEAGDVVSAATSGYLLEQMRPIREHRWGLGVVGATTFKGGWLRQGRVTRQLGLLDGYAVAIATDRGPVARQTDGDDAHVRAMNDLARLLADRLAFERTCG